MSKTREDSPEIAEARAKREACAKELYSCSRSNEPERHRDLERRYNDANRELAASKGEPAPACQKDVREDYKFSQEMRRTKDGETIEVHVAEGPNHDPDKVINWRSTDVGREADKKACESVRNANGATHDGDDAGHLIAMEKGVDPAEVRNISMQGRAHNQGLTIKQPAIPEPNQAQPVKSSWRHAELEANELARSHPESTIRVEEKFHQSRGGKRPVSRTMEVEESGKLLNQGGGKVIQGNFRYVPDKTRETTLEVQANHENVSQFRKQDSNRRNASLPALTKREADIPQATNDNAPKKGGPSPAKPSKSKTQPAKGRPNPRI